MIDDWCHVTGFLGGFFDINRFCEGMELWINQKDMDMSRLFLSDFSHIFSSSFILAASRVKETFLNQVLKCCKAVR